MVVWLTFKKSMLSTYNYVKFILFIPAVAMSDEVFA